MQPKQQLNKEQLRVNKPTRSTFKNQTKLPLTIVLDNVTNSYNIGAFIRLADAFAIEKVIVCGHLTISDKKLNKASRNEAKWVDIEYSNNSVTSVLQLKQQGYTVYSIELCHDSVDYAEVTFAQKSVLVLGNERKGVSEEVLALSHQQLHIPMFGMGNSLNVSTAGAIVLAAATNQRRKVQ
jgi:tRNA G18 (ribose-2'-O)-methylase SpoU